MNSQHLKKQNINSKETNQELLLLMNVLNKHLQISKEDIKKQVDKCHRIGPKNEDGTQVTILKFKSDSFKESVNHARKKIKNRKIKIKISLAKKRHKILCCAHRATHIPNVDFLYSLFENFNLELLQIMKMQKKL